MLDSVTAVASGVAGACALTAVHESARRTIPNAPRMDVLGMRSISHSMRGVGLEPPHGPQNLQHVALLGDLVANSAYYSLVGVGRPGTGWLRGAALGLIAGAGAVMLPGPLGLGTSPSSRTGATQAMTVGWYLLGGVVAGAVFDRLSRKT